MKTETIRKLGDTTRPFGLDMSQFAVGRLPGTMIDDTATTSGLSLSPQEYEAVLNHLAAANRRWAGRYRLLGKASTDAARSGAFHASHVRLERLSRDQFSSEEPAEPLASARQPSSNKVSADRGTRHEFKITFRAPSARETAMIIVLRVDNNSTPWLNVRANPTSLLAGHNAYAVALVDATPRDELAALMRVPLNALEVVLRSVEPKFSWYPVTRQRIEALQFRVGPVQLFTYLPVPNDDRGRFLGFVRAVLSCPFGNGKGRFQVLADCIDVRVDTRFSRDDDVQTLLLVCQEDKRAALSINLYEKDAKLAAEAGTLSEAASAGMAAIADDLKNALRLDLTLHEPALRDLMVEAKLGKRATVPLTAANFVKAVRRLDRGKGRTKKACLAWLLDYTFDKRLPLLRMLNFKPSMVDAASRALATYNAHAKEVFQEWWSLSTNDRRSKALSGGRRLTFEQFAQRHPTHKLSREQARMARRKLLAIGIDPDLAGDAYTVPYAQSYVWGLDCTERMGLCQALEARDNKAIGKLMRMSRSRSNSSITLISKCVRRMLAQAQTPASIIAMTPAAVADVTRARATSLKISKPDAFALPF
jgi:hypothetical protein